MPTVTAQGGYPSPVETDTVHEILLEVLPALSGRLEENIIAAGTRTPADPETTYPVGVSLMMIFSSQAAGWTPNSLSGQLLTLRPPGTHNTATQLLFNRYEIWYRNSLYSNWATWMRIYGGGIGAIEASGTATLTTAANGLAGASVSFPAGRFTALPTFHATVLGGAGAVDYKAVGYASSVSAGFVAVKGPPSTEIKVSWTAIQGV